MNCPNCGLKMVYEPSESFLGLKTRACWFCRRCKARIFQR